MFVDIFDICYIHVASLLSFMFFCFLRFPHGYGWGWFSIIVIILKIPEKYSGTDNIGKGRLKMFRRP
ncbi:hypothetical protein BV914_10665 [Neisseria dumasiana]|nr:hypothetical protein BV914_10665 [Neisseria dumasiana]